MTWIEESLVNHRTHWIHKQNKSKKCCSMLNVLSWLRALKSHTLSVRLTQTNSFLHSHAKAIIPHSYKVLHLFCWFWDRKLLFSLRTYKIILPNVIYSLFPMYSFCTLFNSKKFSLRLKIFKFKLFTIFQENMPLYSLPFSTLDGWCPWNLTLCQQMDLRTLVDINCIATQVKRFDFLEKYVGGLTTNQ